MRTGPIFLRSAPAPGATDRALAVDSEPSIRPGAKYSKMMSEAEAQATRKIEKAARELEGFLISGEQLRQFVYAQLKARYDQGVSQPGKET